MFDSVLNNSAIFPLPTIWLLYRRYFREKKLKLPNPLLSFRRNWDFCWWKLLKNEHSEYSLKFVPKRNHQIKRQKPVFEKSVFIIYISLKDGRKSRRIIKTTRLISVIKGFPWWYFLKKKKKKKRKKKENKNKNDIYPF